MRRVQRVSPLPNHAFDKCQLRQPDSRSDGSTPPRWLRGARRGAAALSQASGAGHVATSRKHQMRCRALTWLSTNRWTAFRAPRGRQVPASRAGARPRHPRACRTGGRAEARVLAGSTVRDAECRSWFAWPVSSRSPSLPKARPTSSLPLPRAAGQSASNRRTMAVGELRPPLARAAVIQRAVALIDDGRRRWSMASTCRYFCRYLRVSCWANPLNCRM